MKNHFHAATITTITIITTTTAAATTTTTTTTTTTERKSVNGNSFVNNININEMFLNCDN